MSNDVPGRDVTIVIPHVHGTGIYDALRSIAAQSLSPLEVIVVDNGVTDGSLAALADVSPQTLVIRNTTNRGFAEACNQGVAAARGDYVLFLNDDAALAPDALMHLRCAAAQASEGAAWQPIVRRADGDSIYSAGSLFTPFGFLAHIGLRGDTIPAEELIEVFAANGCCLLVVRSAFIDVGGFDTGFFAYFEDSDLCWRLRLRGLRSYVVSRSLSYHTPGSTSHRLLRPWDIDFLAFRNRLIAILRNCGPAALAVVLPLHLIFMIFAIIYFSIRRHWRSALAVLRAIGAVLQGFSRIYKQRKRIQTSRRRPDKFVLVPVARVPNVKRTLALVREYLADRPRP